MVHYGYGKFTFWYYFSWFVWFDNGGSRIVSVAWARVIMYKQTPHAQSDRHLRHQSAIFNHHLNSSKYLHNLINIISFHVDITSTYPLLIYSMNGKRSASVPCSHFHKTSNPNQNCSTFLASHVYENIEIQNELTDHCSLGRASRKLLWLFQSRNTYSITQWVFNLQ